MFKNISVIITILFTYFIGFTIQTFSAQPLVNCIGLPGCSNTDGKNPLPSTGKTNIGIDVINNVIGQMIQFVAVIAIIALILSGIMYMLSGGDEEKAKKAKSWITWSLLGVILSISAWSIIILLNNLQIG